MHSSTHAPRLGRSLAAPAALCLLASCGSPPEPIEPLTPPPLRVGVQHWAGSVLSGRRPGETPTESVDASTCLGVTVDLYYVDRPPRSGLSPIASRARLAIGARGSEPLLPVSELTFGVRVGMGPEAEPLLAHIDELAGDVSKLAHLVSMDGALPVGVSMSAHATSVGAQVSEGGQVIRRRVEIIVSRETDGAVSAAVLMDDLAPDVIAEEDLEATDVFKRQIVLLEDAPRVDGAPMVFEFPSRFEPSKPRSFVAVVHLHSPASLDEDRLALVAARCLADLRTEAEAARARGAAVEPGEIARRAVTAGLEALETAKSQRPALVFLAGSSNAPLALDLAVTGEDLLVATWVHSITVATDAEDSAGEAGADIGWLLERSAFAVLARRLDAGELEGSLHGLLAQHAGEAGRFPGWITAALARDTDRAAFEAALVAENLDFLATSDPSSRVRAFDWLKARGRAPEGYDPLGPREARRDALLAMENAALAAREEGSR